MPESRVVEPVEKLLSKRVLVVIIILLVPVGIALAFYFAHVTTVQRKANPDGSHHAKLVRYDGIDVNFKVVVDGENVFWSPDFAPVGHDFREQINWDATGSIVVLEVAGQRLFGYDARQGKKLTDEEVLAVEYPPFKDYWYEGKVPGQTR